GESPGKSSYSTSKGFPENLSIGWAREFSRRRAVLADAIRRRTFACVTGSQAQVNHTAKFVNAFHLLKPLRRIDVDSQHRSRGPTMPARVRVVSRTPQPKSATRIACFRPAHAGSACRW